MTTLPEDLSAALPGGGDAMEADSYQEPQVGEERDLTGDGGVLKTILREGEGWETPEAGDEVTVHYTGTLLDGTKFDSSRDRDDPFVFKLGEGRVIKSWDVGVKTMKKGELSRLTCAPGYAYGAAGSPPSIPPNSTLVFEVELLSWKSVKDVTGDGGVIKTQLAEGSGWQTAKPEDEVVVAYTCRLLSHPPQGAAHGGKRPPTAAEAGAPVVAESSDAVFSVASAPCSGVAAALKTMKPGESARLLLSPQYACGLVDVPQGQLAEVELTLKELHPVSSPAPGISKKVLVAPERSYMRPNDGSTVKLSISAASPDGATVYEAPHEVEFTLDEEQAPEGVELAVAGMVEGERARVTVSDPALTAAPEGATAGCGVPPGTAPVLYDVTLLSFTKAKEKWEMNNAEKLAAALARKDKGNAAYKAGRLSRAVKQYTAAAETAAAISERDMAPTLPSDDASDASSSGAVMAQARDVKKAAALNLAAAQLKLKNWAEAAAQATKVLDLDPSNVKALFRRAQARMHLSELLEAELDVKAALLADPTNSDLRALQAKLKVALRELNKKEAKLFSRMFAALGTPAAAGPAPMQEDAAPPAAAEAAEGEAAAEPPSAAAAAPVVQATA